MKKYIILTVVSVVLSYLMAKVIFMEYKSDKVIALSKTGDKYYFLQLGVYSSYDSMLDNSVKLSNYIYTTDEDKYYVFTCISKNMDNMNKMESYYKELGFDTYVKEFILDDNELFNLKMICDEIFGEENFVNCIAVKMSEATGVKMSHQYKRFPKLKEYILFYKKKIMIIFR